MSSSSPRPSGAWLVKTEPHEYSFADLERDGTAEWDGVTNALAQRHLRAMRPGDVCVVYHSGSERAAVGLARDTRKPYPARPTRAASASGSIFAPSGRSPAPSHWPA